MDRAKQLKSDEPFLFHSSKGHHCQDSLIFASRFSSLHASGCLAFRICQCHCTILLFWMLEHLEPTTRLPIFILVLQYQEEILIWRERSSLIFWFVFNAWTNYLKKPSSSPLRAACFFTHGKNTNCWVCIIASLKYCKC